MRRIYLLILLTAFFITAKAQNHGVVKAVLLDSLDKKPIPFATISVLKLRDSALVSYTITDKNGAFTLRNLHEEPSRLLISHVAYQNLRITLNFKKNPVIDLGNLYLSAKLLKEVIVKGERVPVIIKKDTIEFDAEAFKTRPNAVVEDLLKKLPGVQIDLDGHITVNGKDISKIKVDGKDFFINDPKIATKNLDADMIAKVQVYDDRENDPDHLVPDYEVKKIINLKFKKAFKKSILSNVGAGAGTQDRYDARGFFSKFQDDLQISGNINSNNLSGTDFVNSGVRMSGFGGGSGISTMTIGSLNFNKNLGKKIKLNINYEFNDNVTNNNSTSKRQQFISDTTFNTFSTSIQHQSSNNQGMHIQTEWKIDSVTTLKFNPDLSYSYNSNQNTGSSISSNTFVPLLNTAVNADHGNSNSFQYQHNLNYYRRLTKDGASLNITNVLSVHPENSHDISANDLLSYVAALQSDTLRRSSKNTNRQTSVNLSVGYHLPITKKLSANFTVTGLHDRNAGDLLTYDQDPKTGLYTIYLQDQSSNLIRDQWQQTIQPELKYDFTDKISFKLGLATQLQQISNHFNSYTNDLNQHFVYLLPTAELHLSKVNLSYSADVRQPGINDLQPITIVYSPLFSFIGNPNLKPTRLQNFGINYNNYIFQNQLYMNFSSVVTIESNTVVRERMVTAEGAEVTTPINRNGRFTASVNGNIGKTFKKQNKWQISTQSYVNAIMGHNFFEVNQQSGYQNTKALTLSEYFTANWNDIFELRPGYSINTAITKYQQVDYKSTSYTSQKAELGVDLFLPQKFVWDIDYAYKYNPLVAPGFQKNSNILSLSITRRIQSKDKGELRLSCYDLLNQSVSSYHYASENTVNDIQNQLLKRYFLLTYIYHFKSFGN
ncbi:outer membrane beta-barrel protein [Mucilaginibacter sp.]|uniref:outer membrane beta-barrel protein n=1 Tax=Mucilaginibacter sp. TaxID=1882438 RepID=UPI003D107789